MFYPARVAQLSIFSADASIPALADLAGLLCAQGQIASFAATAARLSLVTEEPWRARLIAGEFTARGVHAEIIRSDCGQACVRTPFRKDLIGLAAEWRSGAVKSVPPGFRLTGSALRLWLLAAGRRSGSGYLLMFDAHAVHTHEPLLQALDRAGLLRPTTGGSMLTARGGGPAVHITGRRRLARLAELVGAPPAGAEAAWPAALLPAPAV